MSTRGWRKLTEDQMRRIRILREQGLTYEVIGHRVGCAARTAREVVSGPRARPKETERREDAA